MNMRMRRAKWWCQDQWRTFKYWCWFFWTTKVFFWKTCPECKHPHTSHHWYYSPHSEPGCAHGITVNGKFYQHGCNCGQNIGR